MAKVLVYAMNYAPEPVGVGHYTGEIGSYLADHGHAVHVVTTFPHYPRWRLDKGVKSFGYATECRDGAVIRRCPLVLKHPMRGLWRLLAPLSFALTSLPILIWEMIRFRPDVVFCVEPTLFGAPVALLLSWIFGARSVLHVQDMEVDAAFAVGHLRGAVPRAVALRCEAWLLRRFDHLVTISGQMRQALVAKGVRPSAVSLIRNWVDLDAIKPQAGRNGFRDAFGWPDTTQIALYAGSIGAKQSLDMVLAAAARLAACPDLLFVITGDGPAKAALMERYGSLPNVRFLPPQPRERLCDLLNLADIHLLPQAPGVGDCALPSKLGGMLATGRPILATADRGSELHDVLSNVAVLVPTGDDVAIARELTVFADHHGHHPHIGDGRALLATMDKRLCLAGIMDAVLGDAAKPHGIPAEANQLSEGSGVPRLA